MKKRIIILLTVLCMIGVGGCGEKSDVKDTSMSFDTNELETDYIAEDSSEIYDMEETIQTDNTDSEEDISQYDGETNTTEMTDSETEGGISPEFKKAMDSYEAFFDEYVAFMQKYQESDDTTSMMSDYVSYMSKYAETMAALDAIDEKELSTEEALYYAEVSTRISAKLLEVAQ